MMHKLDQARQWWNQHGRDIPDLFWMVPLGVVGYTVTTLDEHYGERARTWYDQHGRDIPAMLWKAPLVIGAYVLVKCEEQYGDQLECARQWCKRRL